MVNNVWRERLMVMTVLGWSAAFGLTAMLAGWAGSGIGGRINGAYSDESGTLMVALIVAVAAGALAGVLAQRHRFMAGYRWLPVLLFVAMSAFMWTARGVHHGGDTPRYVGGAERLLSGEPLLGRDSAYVGYIAVVALFQTLGADSAGIVGFQVFISALCAVALFSMGRRMAGELAGVAAASLYAVNVDLARFTFSILTDSLFTSGLLLSTYLAYRTLDGDRRWALPAAATALATGFLRPGGSFFVPIFGVALAFALLRDRSLAWRAGAAVAVLVASVWLNLGPVRAVYSTEDPMQWLVGGYVLIENEEYRMPMPPVGDSVSSAEYCAEWPVACTRLVLRRVFVEFAHTRTFYSFRHNLMVWLTFPLLYAWAVIGAWATRRHALTWLSVAVVGLQTALTGLTLADWDGRLVLFVFPVITLYSGIGVAVLASSYLARRQGAPSATGTSPR